MSSRTTFLSRALKTIVIYLFIHNGSKKTAYTVTNKSLCFTPNLKVLSNCDVIIR